MNKTFHAFSRLPLELRICAWKMAVRPTDPEHPGVHFFTSQRDAKDDLFTTFPSFPEKSKLPEKEDNPSTYFLDFGMWKACKKSRTVVTKQIMRRYKTQNQTYYGTIQILHVQKHITFGLLPEYDLICIQLQDTETLSSEYLNPLRDLNINTPFHIYRCRISIAFEYDASWMFDPEKDHVRTMIDEPGPRGSFLTLLEGVIEGELLAHLYLIQYGATFKPNRPTWEIFYGKGSNFTAVDHSHINMEDTSCAMDAWSFVNIVTFQGEIYWEGRKDDQ